MGDHHPCAQPQGAAQKSERKKHPFRNPPAMSAGAEFIPQTQHDFRQVHKPERIEAKTHNTG